MWQAAPRTRYRTALGRLGIASAFLRIMGTVGVFGFETYLIPAAPMFAQEAVARRGVSAHERGVNDARRLEALRVLTKLS